MGDGGKIGGWGRWLGSLKGIQANIAVPRRLVLVRIFEGTGGRVTPNDLISIHPPGCINNEKDFA